MRTIYHIDITNGLITFDHAPAPRVTDEWHAPNSKQYFAKRGLVKPPAIVVRGWSFQKMYLTHGNEWNGAAVAWA